jgi:hypothetical protein
MPPTNSQRLDRKELPAPRHGAALFVTWTTRDGRQVSVMGAAESGIDANEPWVASCDSHSEMICCPTRAAAKTAARNRDWCSGCRAAEGPS